MGSPYANPCLDALAVRLKLGVSSTARVQRHALLMADAVLPVRELHAPQVARAYLAAYPGSIDVVALVKCCPHLC